ncbi:acetylxylan esterase [Streptomyces sp. NPDC048191]|uniref:acetylxylan esterase n=1 Tax=Streptomyces sp. NPDC048191 TaxID=3155484 RepID=UPI0033DE7E1A
MPSSPSSPADATGARAWTRTCPRLSCGAPTTARRTGRLRRLLGGHTHRGPFVRRRGPADTGQPDLADTFDVTFPGFGGEPVKAWLRLPGTATEPLPAVVQCVACGGGLTPVNLRPAVTAPPGLAPRRQAARKEHLLCIRTTTL